MEGTIYTSRCCGSCRFADDESPSLRCAKAGNMIVDAFYVCPLWREREWRYADIIPAEGGMDGDRSEE